ncbi:MAG: SusC/RagA family TonB-linked outer membrane protein [Bacteroidetes bacterium]|nr:SusC/RagA family TonB-linked outer membrane protein [Bacteroidota bacterium]
MRKILLIFLLLGMGLTQHALAQGGKKVTGKIVNADDGTPIPGVSVKVEGAKTGGVMTDVEGSFIIVANPGQKLVFSYVGFTPQTLEVPAGNFPFPMVRLKTSSKELVEVVVRDTYGSHAAKAFTGSEVSVKGAAIENKPYSTIGQALQGQMAGVTVTLNSGQPGANNQIRIRGINSITSQDAAQPLFVIDGMFVTTGNLAQNASTSNALSGLNNDDIENITVLKDAAATAIYGSRGSNGVIVITTKKGRSGKTQVRADAEYGTSANMPLPKAGVMASPAQYRELFNEAFKNYGYTDAQIATVDSTYALNSAGNDWYDLVTRNGTQQQYNISLSGGDEKTRYFSSAGFFNQNATILKSNIRRISGLLNIEHNINKQFSVQTGLNFSNIQQNTPLAGSAYFGSASSSAFFLRPFQLAYNADGSVNSSIVGNGNFPNSGNYNPLYIADHDKRLLSQTRILGNETVKWTIWDQLKYTGYVSIDLQSLEETTFLNPTVGDALSLNGSGRSQYTRFFNWLVRNQLDYRYKIPSLEDVYVDAAVGYEAQRSTNYYNNAYSTGYPATQPDLTAVGVAATPTTASQLFSNFTYAGLYGKANVNFKSRYSLSGSIRREGSSRFGGNNQYGTFWSVGGAWNIDQEKFFMDQSILTGLKLRSSYGTTGNANALNNYTWRPTAGYGFNYNLANGQDYNTIGNTNLKWESSKKFDIGLDLGFFNDRLAVEVDYYNNKIDGLIQTVRLPMELGFASTSVTSGQPQNIGAMTNRGYEITIKGLPIQTRDFTWSVNFNVAKNTNKMTKLATADAPNGNYWLGVGYSYYTWYARQYKGVNPDNGNALWWYDAGKTKDTTNYSPAARVQYGHADPTFTSGLSNTLTYKGISLTFDFYGSFGNRINDNWSYYLNDGAYITGSNKYSYNMKRWTTKGQITDVPKMVYGGGSSSSSSSFSTRFLYKGDFIRLKNVALGYDFKNISLFKKAGLSKLYLYGRATNLWTKIFDDRLPFDPETAVTGVFNEEVPQVRTFTVGVNVGF